MDIDSNELYLFRNSSLKNDSTLEDDSECEKEEMNCTNMVCRNEPKNQKTAPTVFPL